jgi:holo-[acyl-carrier protein] synthase
MIELPEPDVSSPARTWTDVRVGTDLVFVPRLEKLEARYGDVFFLKILTPGEWDYCRTGGAKRRLSRAAARIAAKEAVAKALGCGLNGLGWGQGVGWREIEVLTGEQSPPRLHLHGRAAERACQAGIHVWRLSLSHDGDYAMATVLALTPYTTE